MLRAITGYFFGGVVEEAPQTVLECDTREVNDWLVVNMADRPEDDIDMDDEIEMGLTDNEYDDILDAVSCLMRTEEYENNEFISDENSSETEDIDSQTWSKSEENSSDESDDDRMSVSSDTDSVGSGCGRLSPIIFTDVYKPFLFFNMPIVPRALDVMSNEIVQTFGRKDCKSYVTPRKIVMANQNCNVSDGLIDYQKAVKVCFQCDNIPVRRTVAVRENCLPVLPKLYPKFMDILEKFDHILDITQAKAGANPYLKKRCPEVTCHPVYSKAYVNHRNPALANKSDLMQKIKQLEIEQAQDCKIKKFISKGQINRQNKNYIFESSCKKNRRKNLQRNPSGANNNRKC